MPPTDSVRIQTNQLPVGSLLDHPINGEDGILLLAAGVPIQSSTKERLLDRGIQYILIHPEDAANLAVSELEVPIVKPLSESKVAELKSKLKTLNTVLPKSLPITGPAFRNRIKILGCVPYCPQQNQRLTATFSSSLELLDNIVSAAIHESSQDIQPLQSTIKNYTEELSEDLDSSLATTAELAPNPDFKERGIRLAILSMAIASELGWDESHIYEVGLCGLVHDWGMFCLPKSLQDPQHPVLSDHIAELTNHPLHTLTLLESIPKLSKSVLLAATQVHENGDGSGYPRGITKEHIHPFANILHVADAYISLTAGMRGRQAFLSYDVIVYLLHQVQVNRMDEKAIRALLKVVSLFPLGSLVELSDGSKAQVLRRNPKQYSSPIVQKLSSVRSLRVDTAHQQIIDLAQSHLKVVAPVPSPHRHESRIGKSQYQEILWEDLAS